MLFTYHVIVMVLLPAVIRAQRGNGQTGPRHGDENVVNVLNLVVLHDQLAVDWMHRLRTGVGNDHVARGTLQVITATLPDSLVVLRHGARNFVLVGGHGAPHVLLA